MRAAAIVVAVGLSALVAGCSGGSASNGSAPAMGRGSAAGGVAAAPSAAGGAEDSPALIQRDRALVDEPSTQRQIVYTAQLSLRVDDVDGAAARAASYADAAGGFLFSERTGGTDAATADLTLKVPAGQFTAVFAQLGRLGKQLSRTEQAQDVTQQVVDLTSRVGAQKASIARLEALMKQTSSVGDIVQIEGELTKRQSDLESLEGQLQVISNQAALATIDLHLEAAAHHQAAAPKHHRGGFVGGLMGGWRAFVAAAGAVATGFGALLPFLLVVGVAAGLTWWVRRLLRHRREAASQA